MTAKVTAHVIVGCMFCALYLVPALALCCSFGLQPVCAQPAAPSLAQDEASLYRNTDAFGAKIDKGIGRSNSGNGTITGQAFKLSGGISHAERLEPLPENERTGSFLPPVVKQHLTIPPKRTFTAAPIVDKTTANLSEAHKQAAIKSQPAKVDKAMAQEKRNMQAVIEANLRASVAAIERYC
jgi:hypothetical protein